MKEEILLVEDEKELSNAISTILSLNGYVVSKEYNGQDALENVKKNHYDLIIMDVMMPVMDGITALKEMKKIGVQTPVILLTAKSATDDKVLGLDSGAEDYLTKPFETKELLARIRKVFRKDDCKKYKLENVTFNKETSEISSENKTYELNANEAKIMEVLIKNQDRKIPKEEVVARAFPNDEANSDEKLNIYVSFLNDKLKALDSNMQITAENGYELKNITMKN